MRIIFVKGREINKVVTLVNLSLAVITFIAANLVVKMDRVLSDSLVILSLIFLGVSFVYSIFWFVFYLIEKKKQKVMNQALSEMEKAEEFQVSLDYVVINLPAEELLEKVHKRFWKGLKLTFITTIIIFVGLMMLGFYNGTLGRLDVVLTVFIFSFFPNLVYLVMQIPPYRLYKKTILRKITLSPGVLSINEKSYQARDISEIVISSEWKGNERSIKFYRTIIIHTKTGKDVYCVDFRDQARKSIRYNGYKELLEHIRKWSRGNQVELTIDYMD
ncbi:MAG: hypothetical protein IJA10_08040 [Lachnospiraceae bacterium]|nr:hypothetical protein [Lachnospiraceae bacterium]